MRTLVVGMEVGPPFYNEFSKLGECEFFDWTQYTEIGAVGEMQEVLVKRCASFCPDLVFMHVQYDGVLMPGTVSRLGGFIVNYTWDEVRPLPDWYVSVGKEIRSGVTLFCSEEDVFDARNAGIEAEFMLPGYDDSVYFDAGYERDGIVFIGNDFGNRFPLSKARREMVEYMKKRFGDNFSVFGHGWGDLTTGDLNHNQKKEAEAYNKAKVAINMSNFELNRYTSDRMMRSMGCGTLCLSKNYPMLEKDFLDGVHLRTWEKLEELGDLTEFFISDEGEESRIAMSEEGVLLVKEKHTWTKFCENVLAFA